jgi:LacI family transcriptional regulator
MSTILDVAKLANVSTATVSRVINSPGHVRPKTRDRVYRAMKTCRYTYNALARGFVTKRSHTIGLIIPTITNPVFSESTRGVQDVANANGYQVLLGNSDYQSEKEAALIEVFRERQVDGLIITTTDLKGEILKNLLDDEFSFLLLYSTLRKGLMPSVGVDNYLGGYLATQHLIQLKHRRIGMLAGEFRFSDRSFHRWHGYKKCLKDNHIAYDPELLLHTRYTPLSGCKGLKRLINANNPPTAVFCSNDLLALGAIEGARQLGLGIPQDISIIGFDDMQIASFISPSLTTIRQPTYEMGQQGAEALIDIIEGRAGKPVHKLLDISLIERESTGVNT